MFINALWSLGWVRHTGKQNLESNYHIENTPNDQNIYSYTFNLNTGVGIFKQGWVVYIAFYLYSNLILHPISQYCYFIIEIIRSIISFCYLNGMLNVVVMGYLFM